ncbi:hypothetical protein M8J77_000389 [Diaphorina citri]|nr:hypothetical protein M8J77_000389 [Diaphorina citri]
MFKSKCELPIDATDSSNSNVTPPTSEVTHFDFFSATDQDCDGLSPCTFPSCCDGTTATGCFFYCENSDSLGGLGCESVGSSEDVKGAPDSSKLSVKKPRPKPTSPNRQGPQQCQFLSHYTGCDKCGPPFLFLSLPRPGLLCTSLPVGCFGRRKLVNVLFRDDLHWSYIILVVLINRIYYTEKSMEFHKIQVCGKVFGNASALAKHKLTHSDERKYVCTMCGKAFKRQDHL